FSSLSCCCFVQRSRALRALPSFPTRRSSDLFCAVPGTVPALEPVLGLLEAGLLFVAPPVVCASWRGESCAWAAVIPAAATSARRSEEHTSELQSRRDLVCRLLLEKKKEYEEQ